MAAKLARVISILAKTYKNKTTQHKTTTTTTTKQLSRRIFQLILGHCKPVACRGCGGAMPPNLPKGPLLAKKWAKNVFFVGGLRGMRFKKST